jgi:nitroimidazol reductase NimA-like FMN-containing flavoprotein (pyridoxamine 5'-phosphate oxidase superfamily)
MEAEHLMRLIITTPTAIVVNAGEVRYVRAEDSTGSFGDYENERSRRTGANVVRREARYRESQAVDHACIIVGSDGDIIMLIQQLTRQASLNILARLRFGRLACARSTQPYVVPIYFIYNHDYLYSFSTVGQKIEWMRVNPKVCIEVDEVVSPQQWTSVIAFGRYEELPDTPEWRNEREFAYKMLQQNAVWWEPGYASSILHSAERKLLPVFYRIKLLQITGQRTTNEPQASPETRLSTPSLSENGWLEKFLRQIRDKFSK